MDRAAQEVQNAIHRLVGAPDDYDALLETIGGTRFVLLGEASHGTHEFYRERALITRRLIEEKHFAGVAVEGDWPDAYRLNRYVRGASDDPDSVEALGDFKRFPAWMWRNADVLDFVGWLRQHNERVREETRQVGFYGLDLYCLHASMQSVLAYLDHIDPDGARRARQRYGCFEYFPDDPQAYGYATGLGLARSCEDEVVNQLVELRRRAAEYARRDGHVAAEAFFHAEQNARTVRDAERYYRTMFQGHIESWNVRDRHMVETLEALAHHLGARGPSGKVVVWAHNSHLGDARATEMGKRGELNVGQLVRQRWPGEAFLFGFTTHQGTVTAASDWGGGAERKRVRPALAESHESLFHAVGEPRFLALTRGTLVETLRLPRLERAIGVIYRPETERASHYFHARLADQFDAVVHVDETRALEPLERSAGWERGELPATFPTAA